MATAAPGLYSRSVADFEPIGDPIFPDRGRQALADYLSSDDGYAAWEMSLSRNKDFPSQDSPPGDDVQGMFRTIASLALIVLAIAIADTAISHMQGLVSSHVAQLDRVK